MRALRINLTTSRFFLVVSSGQGKAVYGSGLDHLGASEALWSLVSTLCRFVDGSWPCSSSECDDMSISSSSSSESSSRSRNLLIPSPPSSRSSGRFSVAPDISARSEGGGGGCHLRPPRARPPRRASLLPSRRPPCPPGPDSPTPAGLSIRNVKSPCGALKFPKFGGLSPLGCDLGPLRSRLSGYELSGR